ncbi:MAG: DUF1659 domain-containing protein [Bacillota bacterium]|jgi:hypothetical protein
MAVIVTPLQSRLRLQFQTGVDGDGKPVYKNKTLNRVKTAASDQDVLDSAVALAGLCTDSLNAVIRLNDNDLAEQG